MQPVFPDFVQSSSDQGIELATDSSVLNAGGFDYKYFGKFELNDVNYRRCENCGFSISKTHADMSPVDWGALNYPAT
jgi:hypothetical protein